MWAACALFAVLTAIRAHQPVWAALAIFSLPSAILNAVVVARGLPHASLEAVEPLDRALIDVVGRDCFSVMGQDHMESPYILRRKDRPELVVELSFVSRLDDDAIRGFAALQHAARTDQHTAGLRQRVTIVRWPLITGLAPSRTCLLRLPLAASRRLLPPGSHSGYLGPGSMLGGPAPGVRSPENAKDRIMWLPTCSANRALLPLRYWRSPLGEPTGEPIVRWSCAHCNVSSPPCSTTATTLSAPPSSRRASSPSVQSPGRCARRRATFSEARSRAGTGFPPDCVPEAAPVRPARGSSTRGALTVCTWARASPRPTAPSVATGAPSARAAASTAATFRGSVITSASVSRAIEFQLHAPQKRQRADPYPMLHSRAVAPYGPAIRPLRRRRERVAHPCETEPLSPCRTR